MSILEITNIGPINHVKITLNKINVFMGQQGSGKSVVAKIVSYCKWVEKSIAVNQSLEIYENDKNYFLNRLQTFHKLEGYFKPDSSIKYKSEVLTFELKNNDFIVSWVDRYKYKRNKISYIPSERNLVVLPEIEKISFPDNYLRSFLFDWLDARKLYTYDLPLDIINLNLQYYSTSSQENYIKNSNNDNNFKVLLTNASSGIQSITPLLVMVDYLTNKIYSKEIEVSYEIDEKKKKTSNLLLRDLFWNPALALLKNSKNEKATQTEWHDIIIKIIENLDEYPDIEKLVNNFNEIKGNILETKNSQIILEEAEQNLFPDSQRFLIYYLFSKINNTKHNHSLTLTTHSPYILYSINNCILSYIVHDKLTDKEKSKLKCLDSMIDPKLISIYQIENGLINNIQDEKGLIQANYFDDQMTKIMDDFYILLNRI